MKRECPLLLVEDNPDDVFFLQRAAKQAEIPLAIQVVNDGQSAVDYLAGNGPYADRTACPLPCLVLLDLKLPYKSGHEVLAWIRNKPSIQTLPVVILTTSAERSDVDRAYRLGANGYLVKPANMNELINQLKALKSFWFDHNVLP